MGDRVIFDGTGRMYEVLEGELWQDQPYSCEWEDLADEVSARERERGLDRCCALRAVLVEHGRQSVFVRRIPNPVDATPPDGVCRVYRWNVPRLGTLIRANERPGRSWYQDQREEALAEATVARQALTLAQARVTSLEQTIAAARGVTGALLEAYADLKLAQSACAIAERRIAELDERAAAAARRLAALDRLGGDYWSIPIVERTVAQGA